MSDPELTEDEFKKMMGQPPVENKPPRKPPAWLDDCNIIGVRPSDEYDGGSSVDLDDLDDGDIIGDNTSIRL